ncbi:purine-binding chemotaxis protein CheW [Duganella sp. CF517]|uniref:chemotaxis protein CheW n=1 Tax=Duganella sp. CF517 TaxID=1881038 RepID=UPI0008D062FE|nr:chemotaxis protein CheW [Duganella sp. CF517]SEO46185.1 purine-binding chemotaxis protein CheW [Duganella sp. CF517]
MVNQPANAAASPLSANNVVTYGSSAIVALQSGAALPSQFLTFMLGEEQFAVGILHIKEIIEYGSLATVPMMPTCVRGVINLRGAVVPVMDLSARFGRNPSAITKRSCIVIVEVAGAGGDGKQVLGMLVDAVNAVVEIAAGDIEPAPSFGTRIRPDFIAGIGKFNGKFVILLAIDRVLSTEEVVEMARSGAGDAAAAHPLLS